MKTAILISGQMRSFAQRLPNLHWMVFRHFPDPHFFVSAADDADADSAELLRARFETDGIRRVFIEKVKQPDLPEPDATLAAHAPFAISVPVQAILRQLWALERCWELMARNSQFAVSSGTTFVRCRPDLHFYNTRLPSHVPINECHVPWWGGFGGINDRFAVMGSLAAASYFRTYSRLPKLLDAGCPLHPESLVAGSLAMPQNYPLVIRKTLLAEFGCTMANGQTRGPEHQHGDIFVYLDALRQAGEMPTLTGPQ